MIRPEHRLAIYLEKSLTGDYAKMGQGVLRYAANPIVAVVDSDWAGRDAADLSGVPRSVPVVGSVDEARRLGADVLVLGTAPSGGRIPTEWLADLDRAIELGMSLVNGLHDRLAPRYPTLADGLFVWDIRVEPEGLGVGSGAAARLPCKRILMAGTDMAVGKMTTGLEMLKAARARGIRAEFVATGQIGICITGSGIPLDCIRVDYACSAVEQAVLRAAESEPDWIIVEGQGALLHPGSTSTLPLMRGSCPTHLVMCHRLGAPGLRRHAHIGFPPLDAYIRLYEDLGEVCDTYPRPKTVGMGLNSSLIESDDEARAGAARLAEEAGVPAWDAVRWGADPMVDWVERA